MSAHYVYRCYEQGGNLAYVGATGNLVGRLTTHSYTSWWAPTIAKVRAKVYPTKEIARKFEAVAIRVEHPRWNVMGRWPTHNQWTEQQWIDYYTAIARTPGHMTHTREKFLARAANGYFVVFGKRIEDVAA